MPKPFSIANFFSQYNPEKPTPATTIEMANLRKKRYTNPTQKNQVSIELNDYTKAGFGSLADAFFTHLHDWKTNRFRLSSSAGQKRNQKAKLAELKTINDANLRQQKNREFYLYTVEERNRIKQRLLAWMLDTAVLLERLYLENGNIPKAREIREEADKLKKKAFRVVEKNLFLPDTPLPSSKSLEYLSLLEYYLGRFNLWRLNFVFGRVTVEDLIKLGKAAEPGSSLKNPFEFLPDWGTVEKMVDGKKVVVTYWQDLLDKIGDTKSTGNVFSLLFFAARFVTALMIAALQAMEETEIENNIRFWAVFWEKFGNLMNDLFWTTFNTLTNFADRLHIPGPVANILLAFALMADVAWTIRGWCMDYQNYLAKEKQYIEELSELDPDSPEYQAIAKNLKMAHLQWRTQNDSNAFALSAATLLGLSFIVAVAGAFFLPTICLPILAIACDGIANIATGIYQSCAYFSAYMQKERELAWIDTELVVIDGKLVKRQWEEGLDDMDDLIHRQQKELLTLEYQFARNNFYSNILLSVVAPALLLASTALCFPVGITATIVFFFAVKIGEYYWNEWQQSDLEKMKARHLRDQDDLEFDEKNTAHGYLGYTRAEPDSSSADSVDNNVPSEDQAASEHENDDNSLHFANF